MSISIVQKLAPTASGPTTSLQSGAFASPVTTGNTVLVFVWYEASSGTSSVTSVTDTTGANAYVKDGTISNLSDSCDVWRASNVTGGSAFKVTANISASSFTTISACEVSGLANASPLDGTGATNSGDSNTASTGSYSTTHAADLLIATFASAGTSSIGGEPTGFSNISSETSGGSFEDGSADYEIVAATQTGIDPTWGTLASVHRWAAVGLAYKGAAVTTAWTWPALVCTPRLHPAYLE